MIQWHYFNHTPLLHNVSSLFFKHIHYWLPLSMAFLSPSPSFHVTVNTGSGNFSSYTNTSSYSVCRASLFNVLSYGAASRHSRTRYPSERVPAMHIATFHSNICWHLNNIKNDMYKVLPKLSELQAHNISVNERYDCVCFRRHRWSRVYLFSRLPHDFSPFFSFSFFIFAVAIVVDFYLNVSCDHMHMQRIQQRRQPHLCMCDVCSRESQSNRINEKCKSNIC